MSYERSHARHPLWIAGLALSVAFDALPARGQDPRDAGASIDAGVVAPLSPDATIGASDAAVVPPTADLQSADASAPELATPVDVSAVPEVPAAEPTVLGATDQLVASEPVVNVSIRGRSRANTLRRSAQAVTVVELAQARQQAADLAEVLARNTAVSVQRAGGLGSRGAFSLAGLGGDRLRFFLDGVPLELMGYVAGVQNVPVNLLDRVEVYQGVVPARFGADALGGAVHLVTDENLRQRSASASYQLGSFGTHRGAASARYFHEPSGIVASASAFLDVTQNDYEVDVVVADREGKPRKVRLPRFHDGYQGYGFNGSVGLVDKPWADRLVLSGFYSSFDNDVQNGATMARPYGEVTFERQTFGVNGKYAISSGHRTKLDAAMGYARLDTQLRDLANCLYDWYGSCARSEDPSVRGEITQGVPLSTDVRTDTVFLRSEVSQRLSEALRLRISIAPTYSERTGKDLVRTRATDALARPRRLFTGVIGVELETTLFEGRLKNIAFAKGYALSTRSNELLNTNAWVDRSRDIYRGGGGDNLRVALTEELVAKASYEYALRQPSTDELFGDGVLTLANLSLKPERSHNLNVGLEVDEWESAVGTWRGSLGGFARWSQDLITAIASNETVRNMNVAEASALGVESAFGWTMPKTRWLSLDGRLTYQDLRNRTPMEDMAGGKDGDRIPSIPYLQSSGSARLHGEGLLVADDVVDLSWNVRYVHSFYRNWESQARLADDKPKIPTQVTQGAALTYKLAGKFATTLEGHNLTNAKVYDFFGVQRPGRAFFAKWTLDY